MPTEVTTGPTSETAETSQQSTSIFDELEQEQSSTETAGEETEVDAGATEGETEEEESTDWLPNEQLKEFPAEVIAKYAKRYGYTEEELADPRIQRILKDKINSDIEIAKFHSQEEETEDEEEETVPEQKEPTRIDPAARETLINNLVHQITDKATAVKFVGRLAEADKIQDPEQRAVAVTEALTAGLANVLPDLVVAAIGGEGGWLQQQFQSFLENALPGIGQTHLQTSYASTIETLRTSNPAYASMPRFGTPEWNQAAEQAAEMMPGMESVVFTGKDGQALPRHQQFQKKAELMFRILTNQPGAVATAEKAIEKGKQIERETAQRKTNAKLGAGQSKGMNRPSTGNDDLLGAPGEIQLNQRLVGRSQ
jgi:hypothetical protein